MRDPGLSLCSPLLLPALVLWPDPWDASRFIQGFSVTVARSQQEGECLQKWLHKPREEELGKGAAD